MATALQTGKLGELVTFKTGKLDSNAAIPDGDYPFFTCSQETLRTNTYSFDTECVLLAGNNANGIFPLKYFKGKFDAYQRTYIVRPRDANLLTTKFLYYALRLKLSEFRSFSTGAATKFLTLTILNETEIQAPPLPVQQRIAGILSAYDELIENSQRRIKILESMARALYREWFVHFRFPGFEHHPRVASPLGDIPQGWEVRTLAELCTRIGSGGTPKRSNAEYWEGGEIDWYKTGELWDGFLFGSQEQITARGQRESTARLFEPGTILMAIYGSPTVGRMGILTRHASCNQAALGLVANKNLISQIYLYFVLFSLREHFNSLAQGAAQQNISKEKVAGALAVMPKRDILKSFDRIAEPLFTQIQTLQRQIQNLRRTRDLLLPRLLSGQIDMEKFEDV
jgi:type I restriction enzyme S subunit